MKPLKITNLYLAGWMVSCVFSAASAVRVSAADTITVDAAKAEENTEIKAEEKTGEKAQASAEPATNPSPAGDFAAPVPNEEVPPTALPVENLAEDVPDTFPVILPSDDPLAFITPEAAEEGDLLGDDAADDLVIPWLTSPSGFIGQPGAGIGNGGLPSAPSGFTSMAPSFPMGMGRATGVLEGFSASASFSGTYNSNANPAGSGGATNGSEDDFILTLGGGINYMSKAKDWTFGGSYSGGYSQYLNQSDLSGYNQGFGLLGQYSGGRLSATLNLSGAVEEGANRYYQSDFVQQTSINVRLNLSYLLSSKTSIQAGYSQSFTVAGGNEYNDTNSFNLNAAALWKYSNRTSFGPGVSYTYSSSGGDNARTSISPNFLLNYRLSSKVSLNSSVGMEFSDYEGGGSSDPSLTGSLGLNYNASKFWGMNLSLFRGIQPDPLESGAFTQTSSVQLGYHRRLRKATLNLGVGYVFDSAQTSGSATSTNSPDGASYNLSASLGMPVFADTCSASVFLGYSDQAGGSGQDSWSSTTAGFSISRGF